MAVSRCCERMFDCCMCRNMKCFILSGIFGIILAIGGGIIMGIGFATHPKDVWDYGNMGMRIAGLIMIGAGLMLINIAVIAAIFYFKRNTLDKPKTQPIYIDNNKRWGRPAGGHTVEMQELKVPIDDYPGENDSKVYRGGAGVRPLLETPGENDSVFKYNNTSKQEDSSFSSIPLPINHSLGSQSDSKDMKVMSALPPRYDVVAQSSNRPTPSPRPFNQDTSSSRDVKVSLSSSAAPSSRMEKQKPNMRSPGNASSDGSEEPLPPSQGARHGNKSSSHRPDDDDDIVGNISVSVKPVTKKKKKSGSGGGAKAKKHTPRPDEMYGGLAEGEEPIPPRVGRKGTVTPDAVLMSSDIEEDYDAEEELAPPPPRSSHSKKPHVR